jgi:hypothetical protein
VIPLGRRETDNAEMAMIEIIGNEKEKHER